MSKAKEVCIVVLLLDYHRSSMKKTSKWTAQADVKSSRNRRQHMVWVSRPQVSMPMLTQMSVMLLVLVRVMPRGCDETLSPPRTLLDSTRRGQRHIFSSTMNARGAARDAVAGPQGRSERAQVCRSGPRLSPCRAGPHFRVVAPDAISKGSLR